MVNTSKWTCREVVSLLAQYGVKRAYVSSGTRCAPIVMALSRSGVIDCKSVIDERIAAFIALGDSSVSGDPVAIVCTSGSALMNYGPALAEAYYRHVPLIVISADRPSGRIDRNDGQTMRQPGALSAVTVGHDTFVDDVQTEAEREDITLRLNELMSAALSSGGGPVHINIEIDEPISSEATIDDIPAQKIEMESGMTLSIDQMAELTSRSACAERIMVVIGQMAPDRRLSKALNRLSQCRSVCIVAEPIANLKVKRMIHNPEMMLGCTPKEELATPDLIIYAGGSFVGRRLKGWLSESERELWRVTAGDFGLRTGNPFGRCTKMLKCDPADFFSRLATKLIRTPQENRPSYYDLLSAKSNAAMAHGSELSAKYGWCDAVAVEEILKQTPERYNLQVSAGMCIRYVCSSPHVDFHRVDSNRGIAGIDGCTSTAIGASLAYKGGNTLLISGDMSALYDLSSLASGLADRRFKMVVIANGTGGIFHVIKTTRTLAERDTLIAPPVGVPVKSLAEACGFRCFEASDLSTLRHVLTSFFEEERSPSLLVVKTDAEKSAEVERILKS